MAWLFVSIMLLCDMHSPQVYICMRMHVSVSQRVMYTANANKTNITYSVECSRSDPPDDDESDDELDDESDDSSDEKNRLYGQ